MILAYWLCVQEMWNSKMKERAVQRAARSLESLVDKALGSDDQKVQTAVEDDFQG